MDAQPPTSPGRKGAERSVPVRRRPTTTASISTSVLTTIATMNDGSVALVTTDRNPVASAGARLQRSNRKNSSIPANVSTCFAAKGMASKLIPNPINTIAVGQRKTLSVCSR